MRIYLVLFGIFSVHAAIVDSMWYLNADIPESLMRTKRAEQNQEHTRTIVDSLAAKHSDSDTKSTEQGKKNPENDFQNKNHHSQLNTPSAPHESLKTTTMPTPISMTTTTASITTLETIVRTHDPIWKKTSHTQTMEQDSQNQYQIVPSKATDQNIRPPIRNPVKSTPMNEPAQDIYAYKNSGLQHSRNAFEDYDLRAVYQTVPNYHQVTPSFHQSIIDSYAQPQIYSQNPEYQPSCGSSVLISCEPTVQQSSCLSYEQNYNVAVPDYHVDFQNYQPRVDSHHLQTYYQPELVPHSSYREELQNEMLTEEPVVGSSHHNHRYGHNQNTHHRSHHYHHGQLQTHHRTTTQKPETLDSIADKHKTKVQSSDSKKHTIKAKPTNETEQMKKTTDDDSKKPDVVKHLEIKKDQDNAKENDTHVGIALMTNEPIDGSTTNGPSQEMRQMQSTEMSKQVTMHTDQMQKDQKMPPRISSDQISSSVVHPDQQAELSRIPSSMLQNNQNMPLQNPFDQTNDRQIEHSQMQLEKMDMQGQQMIPQQMINMQMNPMTLQRQQIEIPQMIQNQMIPQTQPGQSQMQGQQMMLQQVVPMNPSTLEPMRVNPLSLEPIHEFHKSSSFEPMLSMWNPMKIMENSVSQSTGGSPQQMFWEPNGLYYRLVR